MLWINIITFSKKREEAGAEQGKVPREQARARASLKLLWRLR